MKKVIADWIFLQLSKMNCLWFFVVQLAGELLDAGVNRSPSAYLNNPAEERQKYDYNVDKEMTLLKFVDLEWGPIGSFNWFATHGTSMSRTNSLISGDNKGAAARFMEDWFEKKCGIASDLDISVEDTIPRRVSNIIPDLFINRKFFSFYELYVKVLVIWFNSQKTDS